MDVLQVSRKTVKYAFKFRELWGLLVFLWLTFISSLGPDITITYQSKGFYPPFNAVNAVTNIPDCNDKDTLSNCLNASRMAVITIENCLNKKIDEFELEIVGVDTIAGISGTSTSAKTEENLTKLLEYNISSKGVLHFTNLTEISPKLKLKIIIYGSFLQSPWGTPVVARAAARKIAVEESRDLSGYSLLIGQHTPTITGVFLVVMLLIGLRRIRNEQPKNQTSQS